MLIKLPYLPKLLKKPKSEPRIMYMNKRNKVTLSSTVRTVQLINGKTPQVPYDLSEMLSPSSPSLSIPQYVCSEVNTH